MQKWRYVCLFHEAPFCNWQEWTIVEIKRPSPFDLLNEGHSDIKNYIIGH